MTKLQEAYLTVLEDMYNSDCGLLVGKYDACYGSKEFMHGVGAVMEWIAYRVNDEVGTTFENMFIDNLMNSEKTLTNDLKSVIEKEMI